MPNLIAKPGDYKAGLRKAYDDRAEVYDIGNQDYTSRNLADISGQFVYDVKRAGRRRVLDLGCGPGHDALRFSSHGLEVLGVDLSEGMVRRARKKGLQAEVMDYQELSLPAQSFDGVWSARSLIHLPKADLPAVLGSIRRLLRPSGRFYMVVYAGEGEGPLETDLEYYTAQRYFAFYRQAELRAVLSAAGFGIYREWRRRLRRPRHKEVLLAFGCAVPAR